MERGYGIHSVMNRAVADTDMRDEPEDAVAGKRPGLHEARRRRDALSAEERARVEAAVADLLDTLGKTQAMAVLREFAFATDPLRYSDLEDALDVSPSTLSARLAELTEAGLLTRTRYDEVPPRVEYEPTPRAVALFPMFGHLHHWAMEYATSSPDEA